MFGWGKTKRVDKLVSSLLAGEPARAALAALPPGEQTDAAVQAIKRLLFDDHPERACDLVDATVEMGLSGQDLLLAGDGAFVRAGRLESSIALLERALDTRPDSELVLVRLAHRLTEAERAEEALELIEVAESDSMDLQVERGRALLALDRSDQALPVLERAIEHYTREMGQAYESAWQLFRDRCQEAEELHAACITERAGPEAVIATAARQRRLIRAGVNYRLMAESLMLDPSLRPERVRLEHPEQALARLGTRPSKQDNAATHALRGSALLRLGRLELAREAFEAACELDGNHFAGYRGLAAVVDAEQYDIREQAGKLPTQTCSDLLPQVVPDWPALTELEQNVVVASVAPLSRALPVLAKRGAQIRLLPIDVRTVDLPEWVEDKGERFDDRRAMDTLGGVASSEHRLAAARIEDLLDVVTEGALVFAHELAHLAFFELSSIDNVIRVYQRALDVPFIASTYQMSNEHEFFACSYQDFLREQYRLRTYREADELGVWKSISAMFTQLGRASSW